MRHYKVLTSGEYDEFLVERVVLWKSKSSVVAAQDRFLREEIAGDEPWRYSDFIAWLIREGYCDDVPYREVFLGDGDTLDVEECE